MKKQYFHPRIKVLSVKFPQNIMEGSIFGDTVDPIYSFIDADQGFEDED